MEAAFEELRSKVLGTLVLPTSEHYDKARAVYNGIINKKPAAIIQCADSADVIYGVNFAREHGLFVAVRGGGHSGAGFGTCDGGLVIDLGRMNSVKVNPEKKTVDVGGGAKWSDVDHATYAFGLAVPAGVVSSTGVGGLTLGGGHGYLSKKYGLTIDSLLEAQVVLANGTLVTANAQQNSDLYWALRGGSGNFGVVTNFTFQAHPVNATVMGGPMLWPADKAGEIVRKFQTFSESSDEDSFGWLGFLQVPPGPPFPEDLHHKNMVAIIFCHLGTQEEANKKVQSLRDECPPVLDLFGPLPLPALNSMFNGLYGPGLPWYWKGDFFPTLSEAALTKFADIGSTVPNFLAGAHIYPLRGAPAKVESNATAWSFREAQYSTVYIGVAPDKADFPKVREWTRDFYNALHPESLGAGYCNFDSESIGENGLMSTYRGNYAKLVEIKNKYDAENMFRFNLWNKSNA